MAETRTKSAMSGGHKKSSKSGKKSGKRVKAMHIRHAANGGFVVNHDYDHAPGEMPGSDEDMAHIAPDMDALHDHIDEHMQPQEQTPATPPGGSAPAPQAMAGGM